VYRFITAVYPAVPKLGALANRLFEVLLRLLGWRAFGRIDSSESQLAHFALLCRTCYRDAKHNGRSLCPLPEKIGKVIRGHEVYDIATIGQRLSYSPPDMAIICVPAVHAQEVAEQAVAVGIKYIWNFSNITLKVPSGVIVQREVIAGGLAMLTVKMKNDKAGIYQKIE